jgi:hypothetical protein
VVATWPDETNGRSWPSRRTMSQRQGRRRIVASTDNVGLWTARTVANLWLRPTTKRWLIAWPTTPVVGQMARRGPQRIVAVTAYDELTKRPTADCGQYSQRWIVDGEDCG